MLGRPFDSFTSDNWAELYNSHKEVINKITIFLDISLNKVYADIYAENPHFSQFIE